MALTRKMLEALNIEDKAIEPIIEAHSETVKGLKDKLAEAQEKAEKFDEAQSQLDKLQKDDYKSKYEKEKADFAAYKSSVSEKEAKAAKEKAAKAYFESKSITGKNLEIAMRGAKEEINALELDESGKIKSTATLDALINGTYSSLIVSTEAKGAATPTPQGGSGNAGGVLSRKEIMAIKDTTERQKAWKEYLMKKGV